MMNGDRTIDVWDWFATADAWCIYLLAANWGLIVGAVTVDLLLALGMVG